MLANHPEAKKLFRRIFGIETLLWGFFIYCLFDWRKFYEHGVFLGLKFVLYELTQMFIFYACLMIFVLTWFWIVKKVGIDDETITLSLSERSLE